MQLSPSLLHFASSLAGIIPTRMSGENVNIFVVLNTHCCRLPNVFASQRFVCGAF